MALTGIEFYYNIFESNKILNDVFDLNRNRTFHSIDFNVDVKGNIVIDNSNPEEFAVIICSQQQLLEHIIHDEQEMALYRIDKLTEEKNNEEKKSYITSLIERLGLYKKTFKKNFKGRDAFYPLYTSMNELIKRLRGNYSYLLKSKPPHKDSFQTADSNKLIWNGPQAMLFKLFFELTKQKVKGQSANYITASKAEIGKFLHNHFLVKGKEGLKSPSIYDINKYTEEGKVEIKNTRNAKNSMLEIAKIIKASQPDDV